MRFLLTPLTILKNIPLMLALMISINVVGTQASAEAIDLPQRATAIPETTTGIPHMQLGIAPVPELSAELLRRVAEIPSVELRGTVLSMAGAKGFWLSEDKTLVHPDAIIRGREFAHLHPDGSLHASLSPDMASAAIKAGWGISHPWAKKGTGLEGFVMLYTPNSVEELEVVFELVMASYRYVTGAE